MENETTPRLSALSVQALEVTIEEVEYLIAELQLTDRDSATHANIHAFEALNALNAMMKALSGPCMETECRSDAQLLAGAAAEVLP